MASREQEMSEKESNRLLTLVREKISEIERQYGSDTEKQEVEEEQFYSAMDASLNEPASRANSDPPPVDSPPVNSYQNQSPFRFVLRCSLLASITTAVLAFQVGVFSEMMTSIKKDQKISDEHDERMTVILHLAALAGSLVMGLISDRIGRRYTFMVVGGFFVSAPFIMSLAPNNFSVVLGRTSAQIGVGFALFLAPVYVAEMSPASSRGWLSSLPAVFMNVGMFLGSLSNYLFSRSIFNGWRLMLCQGPISLILLACAVFAMPESPRWLVMQGRGAEALFILSRSTESVQEAKLQLASIEEAAGISTNRNENIANVQRIDNARSVFHTYVCALGIQIFRQACGIETLALYSTQIFKEVGITFSRDKFVLTIRLEFLKTIFSLAAAYLVDRVGRRPLLLWSIGGMVVTLFTLGMSLREIDQGDKTVKWVRTCIGSLFVCTASFSIGMEPITAVYVSEIFPLRRRAKGCAIAFAAHQATSAIISFGFLWLYKRYTLGGAIHFFALAASIAWVVFFVIMPETNGRTLEEMHRFFGELTRWKSVATNIDMERSRSSQAQTQGSGGRRD